MMCAMPNKGNPQKTPSTNPQQKKAASTPQPGAKPSEHKPANPQKK